jgi:hypothetical protein
MPKYAIYFNQQWVGDHSEEWFGSRGPLAQEVVTQMASENVLIFAGGLEEDINSAITADPINGEVAVTMGRVSPGAEFLGGLTIIDVPDIEAATHWAAEIARACGWPQEMREIK